MKTLYKECIDLSDQKVGFVIHNKKCNWRLVKAWNNMNENLSLLENYSIKIKLWKIS